MRIRTLALALTLLAPAAHAEKLPPDFKAALEKVLRPGKTFGVMVQKGVPTTSIYGIDGNAGGNAHYSIDVKDGNWSTSQGLLDFNQRAADFLDIGEVMELASVSFKDNRVDLRFVSLESHKVARGNIIVTRRDREAVATNFKFFFPFTAQSAADAPKAIAYIEEYLKLAPSEDEARDLGRRMAQGEADPDPKSSPKLSAKPTPAPSAAPAKPAAKREIKVGMTPLEVVEILGKPRQEVAFENKSKWTYPDITVVFENGRVKEVKF